MSISISDILKLNTTERKARWMSMYIQEPLSFYIFDIHTNGIKKKEYTNVPQQLEIYAYFVYKQAVYVRVQKWKRV